MKTRLKQITIILCAILFLVSQKGVILANASEVSAKENDLTTEAISNKEETFRQEMPIGEKTETKQNTTEENILSEEKKEEKETSKIEKSEVIEEKVENVGRALLSVDASENEAVQAATNLRWSDETPGKIIFYDSNEGTVSFVVHWFKDGQGKGIWTINHSGTGDVTLPCYENIEETGTYTFKVETFAYGVEQDYDLSSGCVSEESPAFDYIKPTLQISEIKNISWSSAGIVSWEADERADMYRSYLYCADANNPSGYRQVWGLSGRKNSADYSDKMAAGYEYYVRVKAISSNIEMYAHSEYSDYIAFNSVAVKDSVNDKLDEAISDADTNEGVKAAVDAVKKAFDGTTAKSELRVAMQTDTATQGRIQTLEDKYKEALGLETSVSSSEDMGIDTSSVKLLGAALNATESGRVIFNMSRPSEGTQKELITASRFKKAIVLNLELEGAGIGKGVSLAVPVTVTMPAPKEINVSFLTVLHYNDDGTYETLPVRRNSDGTISFTVTHFSNFVFGEKEAQIETSDSETSSSTSGSSSDISNDNGTTMNLTVPVWQPSTPDEIKRYSVLGKETVNYITDAKNAYPVTVINAMHGKLCFDSFEAVLGDYTIGRTYNILPAGKDVYKMDSKAKITLDIPKALQKNSREYKMICVTQKGLPVVLNDLDKKMDTITFETNTFYAFALIYKDLK
ncbi:MAG: hypothetical protein PUG54_04465 [Firmicutes bacterium]|nr:hypothetical protein [Bacillota bacterium]